MRRVTLFLIPMLLVAVMVLLAFSHRTVADRTSDPSGSYLAEVSYRTFYSLLPMPPGSSSDKPAFVEIFTRDGRSLGRIPVPMLQMAAVEWEPTAARIQLVGEWDFEKGTCFYWDEAGQEKIFVSPRFQWLPL